MSQRLEKLLAIRKRIIGDFNHHMTEIDTFDENSNITTIAFREIAFEKTIKEFNEIIVELDRIQSYHEIEELDRLLQANRTVQDRYLQAKTRLAELLPQNETTLNSTFFPPGPQNFEEKDNIANNHNGAKLPPIQLKPFDGKFEEWVGFKDLFLALMKKYRGDEVEKLSHLRNHVRGEALDLIKHLSIRNGNYDTALELLTAQFENPSAVIDSHLRTFRDIPQITHTSPKSIRYAITTTQGCLAAIRELGIMTETWDPKIVFDLKEKLDFKLRDKWEEERKGSHTPTTLNEFIKFLSIRHRVIISMPIPVKINPSASRALKTLVNMDESTTTKTIETDNELKQGSIEKDESDPMILATRMESCYVCGNKHRVFQCPQLTQDSTKALEIIMEKELCTNCLYKHKTSDCTSKGTCRICQERHHTLIHDALQTRDATMASHQVNYVNESKQTLLATAIVPVCCNGIKTYLRALIDQGSMINLITETGAQLLNCQRENIDISLFGVSNTPLGTLKHKTTITIGSLYDKELRIEIEALITPHITTISTIPNNILHKMTHIKDLQLADPQTFLDNKIDLLIGAQTFARILLNGIIRGEDHEPMAQNTRLGWILSGSCDIPVNQQINTVFNEDLSNRMRIFWEIEEVGECPRKSPGDEFCENYFTKTTTRGSDGKLIVRIPFNHDSTASDFLGYSFESARKRFFHLERKFASNMALKNEYVKCINEYIELGHAIETTNICHIIPHHAVIKDSSLTTKLRTVFDASAKTTNGFSLNERMHVGPILLEEIWSILLRWRFRKIAITADIEKMYRQFWVHRDDAKFQQILWRTSVNQPLKIYELQTVTFGTAAAPFLAIRCLHYVADSIKTQHPRISEIIRENFYVDDLLTSFDDIKEAQESKEILVKAFSSFGLNLRKWGSNGKGFSADISNTDVINVNLHAMDTCSTLGMRWDTLNDDLSYEISPKSEKATYTKRQILSEIASLFDPLGMIAPIIIKAKLLMQQLWLVTTSWDEEVPNVVLEDWIKIRNELQSCGRVKFPRWMGYSDMNQHISIHGFADASEKGYAGVIYLRTEYDKDNICVRLLTSKTKVAPLKTVSIPRLELCAALLTAKLIAKSARILNIPKIEMYAWSDSMITLAWIATPPYKLKTFVSNRVAEIQTLLCAENWRYISTKNNPADYASRGMTMEEFVDCEQWWYGPSFLKNHLMEWPKIPTKNLSTKNLPELKTQKGRILFQDNSVNEQFTCRYSSYRVLTRITAICIRWLPKNKEFRNRIITTREIINARNVLIRYTQAQYFGQEIEQLNNGKKLNFRSSLLSLSPFVDEKGILRVGGRLNNSCLSMEAKHPAILSSSGHFTKIIIRHAHHRVLHGGIQQTIRAVRDEFWIIRGKVLVKTELRKCITCFRTRCKPLQQKMSDLLAPQVQPNRPFSFTGVDFAGHFMVKTSTARSASYQKCYVSLFICLTTKAIHLELVQSLSTEAFIAALSRFVARRGIPNHMYSDQGTNFIGTANELPSLWYQEASIESQRIQKECANQGITWHFTPGRASHFGGLWEAGVKSMKTHLNRGFNTTKLTFEEFSTVLVQIEACLNSRPLCSISDDPDEIMVLTPGHFLIGQAITTAPHPNVTHIPMGRLSRFQLLQRIVQGFWSNWSHEYLARLQQRPKWKQAAANLRVGQIVLIMEENTPPAQWNLGKITKVFPGRDQLVRCAELKKYENKKLIIITRPIHKLCLLPVEDNCTNEEKLFYAKITN